MSATESPEELMARLRREREKPGLQQEVDIAITGGRDYVATREEMNAFLALFDRLGGTGLRHGDSRGIDRQIAALIRRERPGVRVHAHPARWEQEGRRAGPNRNREMMAASRQLIAFPGGKGTADCIRAALQQGKPVRSVRDEVDRRRLDIERDHLGVYELSDRD